MPELIKSEDFKIWVADLSKKYKTAQIKAAISVNSELLKFYFYLGKEISCNSFKAVYGNSFYEVLSKELQRNLQDVSGLSPRNLRYIESFYLLYSEEITILPQLVAKLFSIPWGHHRCIIDKCKDVKKALYYVEKVLENNWSRAVLLNFLDTDLFERQGKAVTNFKNTLPEVTGDLAQELTKDPYNFNFISLTDRYKEKELKDALISNIEKFLVELGKGFAYMGREVRIEVGSEEKFMDMLFYNTNLHCYVVVEVKINEFQPAYLGQLGFYVSAVNHLYRKKEDNQTIGLLICKSKDNIVAQYALEGMTLPIGISEYELQKVYPTEFRSSLPTIEEIERILKDTEDA